MRQASLKQGIIQLVAGSPVAFAGARDWLLECRTGRVWVTIDGQAGDHLIAKGGRLRIQSNGLVLVEGLPYGAIRLVCPLNLGEQGKHRFDRASLSFSVLNRFRGAAVSLMLGSLNFGRSILLARLIHGGHEPLRRVQRKLLTLPTSVTLHIGSMPFRSR